MEKDGERLILARATLERYERELKDYAQVETVKGADLVGRSYEPLFPYFKDYDAASLPSLRRPISSGVEDGTGVVHIAPGFGEEDMELAQGRGAYRSSFPSTSPGASPPRFRDYEGLNVIHEANPKIIKDLKAKGVVLRHEQYRPQLPALLAHRRALDLQGGELLVRQGHRVPRPHGRAQPGHRLGACPYPRRALRQLARQCARLEHLAQPFLGRADPGLDERRSEISAHRRLWLARRARARFRRAAARPAPADDRRADAPEPGRSDRQIR